MTADTKTPRICRICGRVVYPEEGTPYASGLPVHEKCYATKLEAVQGQEPSRKRPRP
jgi:hypothetical protein